MVKKVSTALGFIDAEEMGITSMHEHVMSSGIEGIYMEDSINFAVSELRKAKKLGLNTMVEASPRRDAEIVRRIAEKAEINIINC